MPLWGKNTDLSGYPLYKEHMRIRSRIEWRILASSAGSGWGGAYAAAPHFFSVTPSNLIVTCKALSDGGRLLVLADQI